MTLALAGVRIVDLTQVMAGPFCTMLLGDLGADVIKVEPPGGDLSRSMGGRRLQMKGKDHAPFLALNRNKRSIVLDLKRAADVGWLMSLLADADVLVETGPTAKDPGYACSCGSGLPSTQLGFLGEGPGAAGLEKFRPRLPPAAHKAAHN